MTPLEKAQARNQNLRDQLQYQWTILRSLGNYIDIDAANLYMSQQRLEHLIEYIFEPQEEVSREAFELDWESTLTEILEDYLKEANRVQLLHPISTTATEGKSA